LCKIDRKIHEKIINFLKKIFGFFNFFYWLRPDPTTLVWAGTVWPKKLKQTMEWPREDEEEEEEEEEADLQLSGAAGGDGWCCGCGPWC
jgi:hypothetical protein